MTLIYKRISYRSSLSNLYNDFIGELTPFAKRIERKRYMLPLIFLKSLEWSIYRWYKTPIRRFYGVKGNELIYMITRRCNERCTKCGIWKTPESDKERMHISHFLECLHALHGNLYQVTLTGGEPLLFINEVLQIAEAARKLDVDMYVVTNGSLITEDFLIKYSGYNHNLVISMDTIKRSKWETFRGRNNFDLVMGYVLLAAKILGDRLSIQSVLAEETTEDIHEIKSFCNRLGINHVVQPYMDFGGTWNEAKTLSPVDDDFVCAARKNICIYNNGDVVKCFDHHRIPLAREALGNIVKEDIISILCKRRSTEVSRIMKTCNLPCKRLSCNIPPKQYRA